ncbi:MAG TPA: hypothetical protein VGH14_18400 [Solirubrobacterales bacterium]|jgi:hypothetical protein
MAAAAALIVVISWKFTFFQDEWLFILFRRDWSAESLFYPHNEHLVVFQAVIDKLCYQIFGLGNNRPEMFLMTATWVACAALYYVWARKRIDPRLAVIGATMLLFFGAAWQTSLWPFEMVFTAPIVLGVIVLLLLERADRRADVWACVLLSLSVGFGSLWISFGAAALAEIVYSHRRRGWKRLYLVLVPGLLYLIWYAKYGHDAEHHLTLENVLMAPTYVFDGLANSVGALLGLGSSGISAPVSTDWGSAILLALIGLGSWRIYRRGMPAAAWPVLAALLSYWLLAAFDYIPGREATSPRYVYSGAYFALMMVTTLIGRNRLGGRAILITAAIAVLTILPNLSILREGQEYFARESALTKGDLGALEIARDTVSPEFKLTNEVAGTASLEAVTAGLYFEVEAQYSPAGYSPAELTAAPEIARHWADVVLADALPIVAKTTRGVALIGKCRSVGPENPVQVRPGLTRVVVQAGEPVTLQLRRFAVAEFPVAIATAPGSTTTSLRIPHDRARQPWYLNVAGSQGARICR